MKLLIDVDGTLLQGGSMGPDAQAFLRAVLEGGLEYLLATNSIAEPSAVARRFLPWGLVVPPSQILNPIAAINAHLRSQGVHKAFVVGGPRDIAQVCVPHEPSTPEVVVLLDFEQGNGTYQDLQRIYEFLQNGVPILAASGSPHYLDGKIRRIDTGAFVALFESLRGAPIPLFGKPSPAYFREALRLLDCPASDLVVIGDDWSTDIVGANAVGCRSILVRSGKYQAGDELKGVPDRTVDRLLPLLVAGGTLGVASEVSPMVEGPPQGMLDS